MDVDDTFGNHVVTFYTSTSLTGSWTQLGAVITTAGTTSIFNSTASLGVGDVPTSGFSRPSGRIHGLEVRNGIAGSAVATPTSPPNRRTTSSLTPPVGPGR